MICTVRGCDWLFFLCSNPPISRATSSSGRCVADRPILCIGLMSGSCWRRSCSRRSRERNRCVPRLVGTMVWISSRMIVSTPSRMSRAREVSIRKSDSGVVISTSGGSFSMRARSRDSVSPDRIATVTVWWAVPSLAATAEIPASGALKFRSTSTPSAFSGEI